MEQDAFSSQFIRGCSLTRLLAAQGPNARKRHLMSTVHVQHVCQGMKCPAQTEAANNFARDTVIGAAVALLQDLVKISEESTSLSRLDNVKMLHFILLMPHKEQLPIL
eukprot:6092025-Amphidinium_carterae.1